MKKLFSFFAAVLFAGSMMAETYHHTFTTKPQTGTITLSEVSWSLSATNLGSYNSNNYAGVQVGASTKTGSFVLTSSEAWGGSSFPAALSGKTKVTEVRLWLNTGGSTVTPTVTIGGVAAISDGTTVTKNSSAGNDYTKATKVTFTPAATGKEGVVVIDIQTVKAGYVCAIEIDCEDASAPETLKAPVISGEATFYGETEVSMTCATDDAVIYYTTDENFQTSPSDVDWVPYTTALTINATTTVWAAALKGSEWSEIAEKTFTKNPSFASFEALVEAELADHSLVEVAFENVMIDSIYVNYSNKRQGIYFTVGETAYEIYSNQNEVPAAWVAGGKVSGTLRGEWTVWKGLWELKPETGFVWAEDLTYVAPSATAISNTAVEAKAVKSLENGILVIEKAGKKYNVMGQIIK